MSLQGLRFGFFTFFDLGVAVAINLLFLQPKMGRFSNGSPIAQAPAQTSPTRLETAAVHSAQRRSRPLRSEPTGPRPTRIGTALQPVVLNSGPQETTLTNPRVVLTPARHGFLPADAGNIAELVRALQRELKVKGYEPGGEDGVAGAVTKAAIMAFQTDNQLSLTAQPTEQLLQHIVLGQSGATPRAGRAPRRVARVGSRDARDIVVQVQRGLKQQGYWPHAVDGQLSAPLGDAIQRYEVRQRLPVTGRISGRLMSRLVRLAAAGRWAQSP